MSHDDDEQTLENNNYINGELSWPSEEEEEEGGGYMLLPQSPPSDEEDTSDQEAEQITDHSSIRPSSVETNDASMPIMEESQAQAIRQAMSGFSLNITPTWAQNLPEHVWKKELLEGIRNQKQK